MHKMQVSVFALLAAGLVVLQFGCEPAKTKAPAKLPPALSAWQAELEKGKAQINVVMASLDALVAATDNPKPNYDEYVKDLDALVTQAEAVAKRREAVKAQGNAYFTAWEEKLKEIGSSDIAKIATARRDELNKEYTAILEITQKGKAVYDPFMSDLQDIKKILGNQLSADGLKAIASQVARLKGEGKALNDHIDKLNASLGKIVAIYSPAVK